MSEFDPKQCVKHEAAIGAVKEDIEEIKKRLFGNGQKGTAAIVERNSVYIKINNVLSISILGALATLIFKVFGGQ